MNEPGERLPAAGGEAARRVSSLLAEAELAGQEILKAAEEEAARHLASARRRAERMTANRARELSDLSDALTEEAERVRTRAAELLHDLDRAAKSLAAAEDELAEAAGLSRAAGISRGGSATGRAAPRRRTARRASAGHERPVDPRPVPEGAVLLATTLALEGQSRDAIEARLRAEFGLEDAGSVVDQLVGPSS